MEENLELREALINMICVGDEINIIMGMPYHIRKLKIMTPPTSIGESIIRTKRNNINTIYIREYNCELYIYLYSTKYDSFLEVLNTILYK